MVSITEGDKGPDLTALGPGPATPDPAAFPPGVPAQFPPPQFSAPPLPVPPLAMPQQAISPAEVLRKRVSLGFAGIVAFGLALAGMYVGGRLFANPQPRPEPIAVATVAHPAPPPVRPKPSPIQDPAAIHAAIGAGKTPATPAPAPAPVSQPAPLSIATAASSAAPVVPALIAPKTGETYLQLAALGAGCTEKYMKELESKGIHASVAPGPSESLYRVVLGPFKDRGELKRQQTQLEAAGIQPMERLY